MNRAAVLIFVGVIAFGWLITAGTLLLCWAFGLPVPWWVALNGALGCLCAIVGLMEQWR